MCPRVERIGGLMSDAEAERWFCGQVAVVAIGATVSVVGR